MAHPREGVVGGGGHRGPSISRRELLARASALAGAGLAAGGIGSLLSAASDLGGAPALASSAAVPLPRPDRPVTWPVFKDNRAIASGLSPERGATLKIYNWVAYINQQCLKNFEKKYHCKVELTTFNTMTEAIAKLQSGQFDFDVFVPTVDELGLLVEAQMIRPLNHSYIPNISQVWPDYSDPFYDKKWQYTVPYTIYTTGIAWRKDHVHENPYAMRNAWAMPWQGKYKGKVAILDDYRESISLGLMKNGIFDLNTTEASQIATSEKSLLELSKLVNVHIDNNDYSNIPSGQMWIHHAWSGDMAAAASYMPKGMPVEVVGYWFPTDGTGPVANDTLAVLKGGSNPVLAHLFLDYMLDLPNVLENISYNGYMQPLTAVTPERLVKEKILPPSLVSTAVLPSYFRRGVSELQLPATADAAWQQAWLQVSQGI
ncbi:MAG TPA: spermidine/putrescine ABC transporter substrate-binding protein [Acidimicrobiales bacterium]|nr:spermidine/putrescine ABC transporter substrate-binding protein [Acidimicrobiales bacterium]